MVVINEWILWYPIFIYFHIYKPRYFADMGDWTVTWISVAWYTVARHQNGCELFWVTLWLFNIAMENGPFIEVCLLKIVISHGYVK